MTNPTGQEGRPAEDHLAQAAEVIRLEARTIEGLIPHLDAGFGKAA